MKIKKTLGIEKSGSKKKIKVNVEWVEVYLCFIFWLPYKSFPTFIINWICTQFYGHNNFAQIRLFWRYCDSFPQFPVYLYFVANSYPFFMNQGKIILFKNPIKSIIRKEDSPHSPSTPPFSRNSPVEVTAAEVTAHVTTQPRHSRATSRVGTNGRVASQSHVTNHTDTPRSAPTAPQPTPEPENLQYEPENKPVKQVNHLFWI